MDEDILLAAIQTIRKNGIMDEYYTRLTEGIFEGC